MKQNNRNRAIGAALSLALTFSVAAPALAAPSSAELKEQLEAAQAELDSLYAQAEESSEALNQTQVELDETNAQIDELNSDIADKEAELADKQEVLGRRVAANYKYGGINILSILFGSDSFESLTSNIIYANRVSESDAQAISDVKTLQAELDAQKDELEDQKESQEALLAEQQSQQETLNAQVAEAENYVNGLDEDVQEALAAEEEAAREAAERAAEEQRRQAEENNNDYYTSEGNADAQQTTTTQDSDNASSSSSSNSGSSQTNTTSSSSSSSGSSAAVSSSVSSAWRSIVIQAAASMVGGTYSYGACSPSTRTFDCSGLTSYAYACAGISIGHSSASQRSFCTKSLSEAEPGDVVWRSGHVGIYIGNGTTIEAFSPSQGIGYGSIKSFVSCGSPVA